MSFRSYDLLKLVQDFGEDVTLRKRASGAYNNATGSVTTTNTDYIVKAYFYDYIPNMIDGNSIVRDDRKVVLGNKLVNGLDTPEPDVGDQVSGLNGTVNIIKVTEIRSSGGTMCYILQVRE